MSKITFRADDDLVERLETFDASKSEVMREALRAYLDSAESGPEGDDSTHADPETMLADNDDAGAALDVEGLSTLVDDLLAKRLSGQELSEGLSHGGPHRHKSPTPDVTVNVTLDGVDASDTSVEASSDSVPAQPDSPPARESDGRKTDTGETTALGESAESAGHGDVDEERPTLGEESPGLEDEYSGGSTRTCGSCGESMAAADVYCPNCGEKRAHRVFCECGDELRSDWSFCPGCGRRTPAADVLDRS